MWFGCALLLLGSNTLLLGGALLLLLSRALGFHGTLLLLWGCALRFSRTLLLLWGCALLLDGALLLLRSGTVRLRASLLLGFYAALRFGSTVGFCSALLLWGDARTVFRGGGALLLCLGVVLDGDATLLILPDGSGGFGDVRRATCGACGTGKGGLRGTTVVSVVELGAVLGSFCADLGLRGDGTYVVFMHRGHFSRAGSNTEATLAAVVADAIFDAAAVGVTIENHGALVDVSAEVYVGDGAVVVEVVAVPVAAKVAGSDVAEAIVNTAVKSDVEAPVAVVEAITAAVEAPIGRRPESAVVRRRAPNAGRPVVALIAVGPVAWGPNVVGVGSGRLIIIWKRRRGLLGVLADVLVVVRVVGLIGILTAGGVGVALLRGALFDGSGRLLAVVGLGLLLGLIGRALAEDLRGLAARSGNRSEVAVGCIGIGGDVGDGGRSVALAGGHGEGHSGGNADGG